LKPETFPLPAIGGVCVGRRRPFVLPSLVTLSVLFFLSPVSLVRAQGFQGVEPGQIFEIDAKSGVITDTLPFDVHFYLKDEVEDSVVTVEGRALGFETAQTCEQALKTSPDCSAPDKAVVDCHPAEKATPKGDPGKRTFELLVTRLQPNRYYCFQINRLLSIQNEEERTRVANAIAAAVAMELTHGRWLRPEEIQSLSALEALRRSLTVAAGTSLGPDKVVAPREGSFFDLSVPVDRLNQAVGEQIAIVAEAQGNVVRGRDLLANRASGTASALSRLSTSPLWQIVVEAFRENAAEPRVEQFLRGRDSAFELIGLSQSEIVARSEGHTGTLDQIWDSAQIDFRPVLGDLGNLQGIARDLRTNDDIRGLAGLGETALRTRLAEVCGRTLPANAEVCSAGPVVPLFLQQINDLVDDAVDAFDENLETAANVLKGRLDNRAQRVTDLAASLQALLLEVLTVRASTVASYETRATWYVGADLGTALAWDLEEAFTYGGANIYFRPVNKKAHLSWDDWRPGQRWTEFRKRFSVMIGLPQDEIEIENTEPLIQDRPVLLAAGIRLTDFLRFTFAGALIFKEKDPNPLVDDERLAWSPFVGLSIDWNIAGTFRTMFQNVFPGNNNNNQQQPATGGGS
jgi:hypothetical protein